MCWEGRREEEIGRKAGWRKGGKGGWREEEYREYEERNMGDREDEGWKKARDREKDKSWTIRRWKRARNPQKNVKYIMERKQNSAKCRWKEIAI
jgi:hypothetical protein